VTPARKLALYGGGAALALLVVAALVGIDWRDEQPAPAAPPTARAKPPRTARKIQAPEPAATRWLAIGGGAGPDSNQLSLESDLALAVEIFEKGGRVLFAGGPDSEGVQVAERRDGGDPLLAELASLFAPRAGRNATYRMTKLAAHGPATRERVRQELSTLGKAGREPLLVYFASHGDIGSEPARNVVSLWGGGALAADELATLLDDATRPMRLVIAACFSGGFAEMVFRGGYKKGGPAAADRCGLFSSTWDLEASGCDPDPDRKSHESYGVYFLHALRGRDRHGKELPRADVDFDGDGKISLAEAHARVRIVSRGIEVPTTTSERWLREVALPKGSPLAWPEEEAVIAALEKKLKADEERARSELERLDKRVDELSESQDAASSDEQAAYEQTVGELLARWPVLDDPWHPDFAATVDAHRDDIEKHLDESAAYRRFRKAGDVAERLEREAHRAMAERAPYERLVRALDNRRLAGQLKQKGGPDWQRFEALRTCERSAPP
jgi:hypothetical protein